MDELQQSVMEEMLNLAASREARQLTRQTIKGIVASGYQRLRVTHRPLADAAGVYLVKMASRRIIQEQDVQKLGIELQFLIRTNPGGNFLLSLENVDAVSSAVLGKLIVADRVAKSLAGKFILTSIKADLYEVFKTTQLHQLLDIKEDEAAAMAAF